MIRCATSREKEAEKIKVEGVKKIIVSVLLLFCCNNSKDVYTYKIECRFIKKGYMMTNNSRTLYYGFDGKRIYPMLNFERVEVLYPKDTNKQVLLVNRK